MQTLPQSKHTRQISLLIEKWQKQRRRQVPVPIAHFEFDLQLTDVSHCQSVAYLLIQEKFSFQCQLWTI